MTSIRTVLQEEFSHNKTYKQYIQIRLTQKSLWHIDATLSYGRTTLQQELYIVQDLEPLLGGSAIKALNLLSKMNTIKSDGQQYKNDFASVFTGLGKLGYVYKIHLN